MTDETEKISKITARNDASIQVQSPDVEHKEDIWALELESKRAELESKKRFLGCRLRTMLGGTGAVSGANGVLRCCPSIFICADFQKSRQREQRVFQSYVRDTRVCVAGTPDRRAYIGPA
jgi:hypothetical protein